jgi:hypothetical protein
MGILDLSPGHLLYSQHSVYEEPPLHPANDVHYMHNYGHRLANYNANPKGGGKILKSTTLKI